MAINQELLSFLSNVNYMKRSDKSGSKFIAIPSFGNTTTHVVNHNLGYIPYFDVFMKYDDGIIWAGEKIDQYTDTSLGGINPESPTVEYWCTETALTISVNNTTFPIASGSCTLYWVIYLDYGKTR